jgi:hypothetical protein
MINFRIVQLGKYKSADPPDTMCLYTRQHHVKDGHAQINVGASEAVMIHMMR